jgi:hypothetical protein
METGSAAKTESRRKKDNSKTHDARVFGIGVFGWASCQRKKLRV